MRRSRNSERRGRIRSSESSGERGGSRRGDGRRRGGTVGNVTEESGGSDFAVGNFNRFFDEVVGDGRGDDGILGGRVRQEKGKRGGKGKEENLLVIRMIVNEFTHPTGSSE